MPGLRSRARGTSVTRSTTFRSRSASALSRRRDVTRELTRQDLLDLARGAAFLGTGGGGDPYIGRLMVERALAEGGRLTLISPDEVPDDAFVIPTAMMGAPTVLVEKIPAGHEAIASLRALEKHLGKRAYATMP